MKQELLTDDHPIIKAIMDSQKINDEIRLLALSELDRLEQSDRLWDDAEFADDVDELFEWNDSELGVAFWSKLQDKVFTTYKRTC